MTMMMISVVPIQQKDDNLLSLKKTRRAICIARLDECPGTAFLGSLSQTPRKNCRGQTNLSPDDRGWYSVLYFLAFGKNWVTIRFLVHFSTLWLGSHDPDRGF